MYAPKKLDTLLVSSALFFLWTSTSCIAKKLSRVVVFHIELKVLMLSLVNKKKKCLMKLFPLCMGDRNEVCEHYSYTLVSIVTISIPSLGSCFHKRTWGHKGSPRELRAWAQARTRSKTRHSRSSPARLAHLLLARVVPEAPLCGPCCSLGSFRRLRKRPFLPATGLRVGCF